MDDWQKQYVDLAGRVRAMRAAQKRYFKYRSFGDLEESKRLEAEVDDMLATGKCQVGPRGRRMHLHHTTRPWASKVGSG